MDAPVVDTLTVVFTDVVDSTRLRTTVGERDAEHLRSRVEAVQSNAIAAERGRIVKGLGDGLMAVFPAAMHALRAAGRMAIGLDALSSRLAANVSVRIGVGAGDVRIDQGDVHGTPAIEAARLCAVAEGGEILLTDVVRVLAGSWTAHPLDDRGEISLKGLEDPVRHWSLAWRGLPAPPAPDVGLLVDDEFTFVGRDAELTAFERVWSATSAGAPATMLITGEPGVGKTRLAIEMARRVVDDGGLVLAGRCEQDATVPLEPFQHIFAGYVRETPSSTIVADAGPFAPELARHLIALTEPLGADAGSRDTDQDAERFRLYAGVTRLLQRCAQRQPILLIIDDLQWADATSRTLVDRLARTTELGAACLIATSRDHTGGNGHVARLRNLPGITGLTLSGIEADHLADLVHATNSTIDVAELWERSDGHPFFAVELIRQSRRGAGDVAVPASVRDLVHQRAAHLQAGTSTLLTVGALVGYEFDLQLAAAVAALDDGSAMDAAEEAVAARLLLEVPGQVDRFQFTHALVAETFADLPSAARAMRIQARIAGHLRERRARPTQVAQHTLKAAPLLGLAHAVDVARDAAQGALLAGEPEHAAALLERALQLDLTAEPDRLAELEIELGEYLNHAGRAVDGVAHFQKAADIAIERDRFDLLSRAALGCWGGNPWYANADRTAQRLLRAAIDRCPRDDDVRGATLRAGLAAFSIFTASLDERDRITADAVELVRGSNDRVAFGSVLSSRHVAISCPLAIAALDEVRRELEPLNTELPLAAVPGDLVGISASDYWRGDGLAYRRAAASFDLSDPRLARTGITVGSQLQACVALFDGRTADARRLADRALAVGAWGDSSVGNQQWQLLLADWFDGRVVDARDRVAAAYRQFGGQPMRLTHAWVEAAAGAKDTALALLTRVRRDRLRRIPELFLGSIGLAAGATAVVELGDTSWAHPFITAFGPIEHLMSGVPWAPFPAGAFYVGLLRHLLGDIATADACFERATEIHERMRAPAYVALTQAEHGRALLARDRVKARRLLRTAETFARDMGVAGVLARAVNPS